MAILTLTAWTTKKILIYIYIYIYIYTHTDTICIHTHNMHTHTHTLILRFDATFRRMVFRLLCQARHWAARDRDRVEDETGSCEECTGSVFHKTFSELSVSSQVRCRGPVLCSINGDFLLIDPSRANMFPHVSQVPSTLTATSMWIYVEGGSSMNFIWVELNFPSFTARKMVQIVVSGDWKVGMEPNLKGWLFLGASALSLNFLSLARAADV